MLRRFSSNKFRQPGNREARDAGWAAKTGVDVEQEADKLRVAGQSGEVRRSHSGRREVLEFSQAAPRLEAHSNLPSQDEAAKKQATGKLLLNPLVPLNLSVTYVNYAVGVHGDVVLMGYEHDRISLLVQAVEQAHDFVAGGRIKVPGRLIRQKD